MSRKTDYVRYVPRVLAVCVVALVAFGLVYFIQGILDKPVQTKKMVQQITLIQPPPPPPPPPKLEEPPPEEEKIVKEEPVPEETPPDNNEPPPGADLGLDADGGAGGDDAFGLLGKKGGRDLLLGGASRFAWYSTIVKQNIDDLFAENAELRKRRYSVEVRVWIKPDGQVDRAVLAKSTGDAQTDQAYRAALAGLRKVSEPPPKDLPKVMFLKFTSRS